MITRRIRQAGCPGGISTPGLTGAEPGRGLNYLLFKMPVEGLSLSYSRSHVFRLDAHKVEGEAEAAGKIQSCSLDMGLQNAWQV